MTDPETYHLLLYDYAQDILERRGPHREEHLARIASGRDAGRIAMAGPLGDPPHGAAIVFKGVDRGTVEEFTTRDEGRVGMYVCGPTVQNVPHFGHARAAVVPDVMRRWLTSQG